MKESTRHSLPMRLLRGLLYLCATVLCAGLIFGVMGSTLLGGPSHAAGLAGTPDEALMDHYDMYMTNRISDALEGVMAVEKVYWLKDEDIVAPKPDPDRFGYTPDPGTLTGLADQAAKLLDGQELLFSTDTVIKPGSEVVWYLDDTILCISWKTFIGKAWYTFSEVKIAHPSQFRRFLADGTYGSERQYYSTDMAASVNAVTASNGDFYKYRAFGIVVYNGQVHRAGGTWDGRLDTCFIDDQGDLLFTRGGELKTMEEVERYVQEHNVRFSLAFGPVLIEDGKNVVPADYALGEVNGNFSRAAIAQIGPLHYLVAVTGYEFGSELMPTTSEFADVLVGMGVDRAYAMDGGQTAVVVTNNELINRPNYGFQRTVSDIIYFATAVPDGG